MQRILLLSLLFCVGAVCASPTLIFEGSEPVDFGEAVPDAYAPSIGTGTCMGVATGAMAVSGFGISGGASVTDEECQIRYNSVRLEELGQKEAATQILCLIPSAFAALAATGYGCALEPLRSQESGSPYDRIQELTNGS